MNWKSMDNSLGSLNFQRLTKDSVNLFFTKLFVEIVHFSDTFYNYFFKTCYSVNNPLISLNNVATFIWAFSYIRLNIQYKID